jgi:GTP-binding protein EngB required for normal cell division
MPRNRQKWLTDKLKGHWLDKDDIIAKTLIECLRNYVEKEKGLKNFPDSIQAKSLCERQRRDLQQMYDDLSSAYEYIVTKYDNIEEEYNQNFDSVRKLSEMIDRQTEERDAAIEKIWRHHKKMWV